MKYVNGFLNEVSTIYNISKYKPKWQNICIYDIKMRQHAINHIRLWRLIMIQHGKRYQIVLLLYLYSALALTKCWNRFFCTIYVILGFSISAYSIASFITILDWSTNKMNGQRLWHLKLIRLVSHYPI